MQKKLTCWVLPEQQACLLEQAPRRGRQPIPIGMEINPSPRTSRESQHLATWSPPQVGVVRSTMGLAMATATRAAVEKILENCILIVELVLGFLYKEERLWFIMR